jgi:hypothetical protein
VRYLPPVSSVLRQHFQQNGYAVVPHALPAGLIDRWWRQAEQLKEQARTIKRADGEFELVYRVVTGETIRSQWPELFAFYNDREMLDWIKDISGEKLICTSQYLCSAVNLNIMESAESVYRWHFDAVAYTALIYLNDILPEDGGAMQMVPGCEPHVRPDLNSAGIVELWPTAGTLILMDGTRCYHRVSRLLRPTTRLSIPLVYPNTASIQRPAGLDSYLYKDAA